MAVVDVVVVSGAEVVVIVVDARASSMATGFLMAGATSLLNIGCMTRGLSVVGLSFVSWGKTLLAAGRSSKKRKHRAHVQPIPCLILGDLICGMDTGIFSIIDWFSLWCRNNQVLPLIDSWAWNSIKKNTTI